MDEKRMLIMPAELVKKIDDNRGDMKQAEFIDFLINNQLKADGQEPQSVTEEEIRALVDSQLKEKGKELQYVTKEEVRSLEQDIKKLLRNFIDFFVNYGMELGKQAPKSEFEELSSKLHELEDQLGSEGDSKEGESKEAKIKWK